LRPPNDDLHPDLLWRAVDEARGRCAADPVHLAEHLAEVLAQMPGPAHAEALAQLIALLDRADHWELLTAANELERSPLSARAFLELRLWLVASGRAMFEQALREPERLAELIASGDIEGGYYRELGALLRDHADYARILDDDEEGDEPARAAHGAPGAPLGGESVDETFGALAHAAVVKLLTIRGSDPRDWALRLALLVMLAGSVALIRGFGWWALVLVPVQCGLTGAALIRWIVRFNALTYLRRAKNLGSAAVLHGELRYELHFDEPEPSERTVARTRARVEVALAWLREQAAAYGHEVRFRCTAIEHGISERPLTTCESELPEHAHLIELRRGVRRRLAERVDDRRPAFVLVFTAAAGYRACAWPSRSPSDDPLELCVCPLASWPGTIAHEVLHLFGAQDLYYERPTARDPKEGSIIAVHQLLKFASTRLASWTLTRSIMRLSRHPHAVVDPLTAYSVGWLRWPRQPLPLPLRTPWADE
jgi:hypothetical protein